MSAGNNSWINTQRLVEVANADGEFLLQARLWNARINVACDADAFALTIVQGRITHAAAGTQDAEVRISGSRAGWDEMLKPIPKPFFHDLRAAAAHHGFTLAGDVLHTAAYFPAIRRLIELMREIRNANQ